MAKKSGTDTVLMLGAIGIAIIVLYAIYKQISKPKSSATGLTGGGSGGNSYAPPTSNPQNPNMPPINFGGGAGSGGGGGNSGGGGSYPPFSQTPLGQLVDNSPVPLPEDNNSLVGDFGDYSNGGAAFMQYDALQNVPNTALLSLDAGGNAVSSATNDDSHPSSWDIPGLSPDLSYSGFDPGSSPDPLTDSVASGVGSLDAPQPDIGSGGVFGDFLSGAGDILGTALTGLGLTSQSDTYGIPDALSYDLPGGNDPTQDDTADDTTDSSGDNTGGSGDGSDGGDSGDSGGNGGDSGGGDSGGDSGDGGDGSGSDGGGGDGGGGDGGGGGGGGGGDGGDNGSEQPPDDGGGDSD
jgi:hypothetical protein